MSHRLMMDLREAGALGSALLQNSELCNAVGWEEAFRTFTQAMMLLSAAAVGVEGGGGGCNPQ